MPQSSWTSKILRTVKSPLSKIKRKIINPRHKPICKSLLFEEGCRKICEDLNLDYELFINYISEDDIGGYPEKWPSGSIFEIEGQILYALTRLFKPEIIIEFGTFRGCSAEHFLKALDANSKGKIYTIDIIEVQSVKIKSHPRAIVVQSDGIEFSEKIDFQIDLIFEDGPHSTKFTQNVLENCLSHLNPNGLILIHDVCAPDGVGQKINKGVVNAVGEFNKVLIEPSDCGLGYWRKS